MTIENRIRTVLKNEYKNVYPKPEMKARILNSIPFESRRVKSKKRFVAGLLIAALLIPSIALAGYNYLADQVWGSIDNTKQIGGTQQTYDRFESKLQQAQSNLEPAEFGKFILLLKDMTYYHLKMSDIKGNLHQDRLSPEERKKYEQITNQIQPYFDKLNKSSNGETKFVSIEESQKMLSFPIKQPSYVPEGYTLLNQTGVIPKKGLKPDINMQYKKNEDTLLIMQFETIRPQENMPQKFDNVTGYLLNGYLAKYGESKEQNGCLIWLPKSNEHNGYHIYLSGKLPKQELEKIALSMIN